MNNVFIIYPTQLFKNNDHLLKKMDVIYLIEEPFYFTSKKFHKQKLILHRASMKCYYDKLKLNYKNVHYLEFNEINYKEILKNNIHLFDPIDKPIINFLKSHKTYNKDLFIYDSPAFIETIDELTEYRNKFTNKKNYYHDRSFYKWQRKKLNILMNGDKPDGGEWSYDKENRNSYDSNYIEPKIKTYDNKYIQEAETYINKNFKDNFGLVGDFYYPISHEETFEHLKRFIHERLQTFGKYQDGISKKVVFGSHSVLSPMLNIGLITPEIIIKEVMKYYNSTTKESLINVEAFIRQLIGWRSYMRFIYHFHGDSMIYDNLFKSNKNNLPSSWYSQTTNIGIIDDMIYKTKKYAYLHHIERLMIMGNFAFICQIKPSHIYDWFMICFIDAYEWVMIPNVYGMSQYSLTSISMMTKPYLSSCNYIKKMSDYKKEAWFPIWDALYWNFIYTNKDTLKKIYGTAFQVKLIEKMDKKKLEDYQKIAKQYLN